MEVASGEYFSSQPRAPVRSPGCAPCLARKAAGRRWKLSPLRCHPRGKALKAAGLHRSEAKCRRCASSQYRSNRFNALAEQIETGPDAALAGRRAASAAMAVKVRALAV